MNTNTLTVSQAAVGRTHGTILGRLGALAGIGFAILFVIGMYLLTNTPVEEVAEAELLSFYADSGNRVEVIAGLYMIALAGVLFVGFLANLRAVLNDNRAEGSPLASLATMAGSAFVTLLFGGASAVGAISVAMEIGSGSQPGVDVTRILPQFGYTLMLLFGMFAASTMILAVSAQVLRTNDLPRWFGWLGIASSVLLLGSIMFFPIVMLPIWIIAASIILMRHQPTR